MGRPAQLILITKLTYFILCLAPQQASPWERPSDSGRFILFINNLVILEETRFAQETVLGLHIAPVEGYKLSKRVPLGLINKY